MSIRQPKPKQIRLPFDVPKPKKGADAPTRACGICKAADSKYTCPRCNVPYCSLACFQSQAHAQCSEPFYKATVMDQIALDPEAEAGEKRKMVDMLRRFEEAYADGEDLTTLDDEDDDDDLANALEGVDLDAVDSNTLLKLLPPQHRDAFLAAIQNPDSEDAKALLEAALEGGEGEGDTPIPSVLPWWEADDLDEPGESYAEKPPGIGDAAASLKPALSVSTKLVYNFLAICIAYIHTLLSLRLPSLDSDYLDKQDLSREEVKRETGDLVPFLLQPSSTARYESARDAWGGTWEAIGKEEPQDPKTLLFLLDKVVSLLHPPITTEPPRAVRVLDDLYRFFTTPKAGAVSKKVVFYAAAMAQLGREDWLKLEAEVNKEIDALKAETTAGEGEREREVPRVTEQPISSTTPKIELLD